MAFTLPYKFGVSKRDLEISDGAYEKLNSYAKITKIEQNTVKIDLENLIEGEGGKFQAGEIAMIHCSATNRETADFLGKYLIAQITLVSSDGVLTFDKNIEKFFEGADFDYEYLQVIVIARFHCLKLNEGALLTCPPYNPYTFTGGILAVMCNDTFEFNGGHILLTDCGIPVNRKNSLRPLHTQETAANGETDQAKLAGQENFLTKERFLLNAGDGAVFIMAKKITCNENSRIGNIETHGAQFCRGNKTSVGVKPSNVTNIGGSTILLAAETIENFTPKIIAKYRCADAKEGRGLCRCYIASNTKLRADEGLYSYDTLSNPARVQSLGIENFGNGSFGDAVNPTQPLNNYAKVTSISNGGFRLTLSNKTLNGLAPFRKNALVIALVTQKSDKYTEDAGKFVVGRIIDIKNDSVTLDKAALNVDLDKYNLQLISTPEFSKFELSQNYTYTPKYKNGTGGVFVVAVAGTFDISNGKINLEGKGGGVGYGRAGLAFIGNAQNSDRLPIGEGHGSAFILAKKLIMNENSRIGGTYSGDNPVGGNNSDGTNKGGGYAGAEDENSTGSGGGYIGGGSYGGNGGAGASGGTSTRGEFDATKEIGGYGSNGNGGLQGAHLMIIADTIKGFTQAAISTGGGAARGAVAGSASQGGGGSKYGAGGSGAFAFIYCNNTEN